MSPLFYTTACIVFVCAVCLAIIEYRVRKIANELRMARIEMERNKKARIFEHQRKEVEKLPQQCGRFLR